MQYHKQPLSFEEVLGKLMKYCSYQERSELEVKQKASSFGVKASESEELIEKLKKENFQNEKRFAAAYVRGKVNAKRWGLFKIREGLSSRGVSSEICTVALKSIEKKKYKENLKYLLDKKLSSISSLDQQEKAKVYRYLLSKGYESDLITELLATLN